ncbi:hypothetical protein Tco_0071429 [Tanacetum coccineum]
MMTSIDDVNWLTDSDNDGDDFVHPKLSTHDEEDKEEEDSDPRVHTPSNYESTDDEESDEEIQGANVEGEEMDVEETNEEDEANELYRDVNVNLEGRDTEMTDAPRTNGNYPKVIKHSYTGIDSIFNLNTESTSLIDVSVTTIAEPPLLSTITLPPPPTPLITHLQQTPIPTPATATISSTTRISNFSLIPGIVDAYLANKMHEAVKIVVQLQSDRLRDEAPAENADFINKLDDNIKKIIKDQVKEQVKAQVSKILPKIKKTVNKQLEAEVLTRSSNESKTSHVVAANLSKLEHKKILIDKMESNKSIHIFDEQKNLYKALVDAYESDKLILDTYGEIFSFKRRRDEEDKDEEPSAGSNRGSKRRRTGKEPESTSAPKEKTSKTTGKLTKGLLELEYLFEEVYKATTDQLDWINPEGQQYPHDLRKPLPLIPNSRGRQVIPFDHFINNDLEYLSGGVSSRKYATSVTKTKAADYGHIKWIEDLVPNRMWSQVPISYDKHALWGILHWGRKRQQFYGFAVNRESARDVYSKCRIIAVTKLEIVDSHNYKHLDWITVRRDDDKLYKFKEGDFNRLRIQDIEDMLLILVQGKLTNLTVEERLAFNVSLRMFTRSVVIQRRVEDLQLGVESYQKKLNLTKPDTYRPDLKRREAYTSYSNLRGFIYQNKEKNNRLISTLNDVRTALNDRLKGIRMEYLPQTIWRQSDKDKAGAMIQAIDKQLKTRRIMRSLEKFVGGRPYEGDFRLLQRTI